MKVDTGCVISVVMVQNKIISSAVIILRQHALGFSECVRVWYKIGQ